MNLTKNKKKQIEGIDFTKSYKISDAVKIIKEKKYVKFDESLEVSINTGIDSKQSDQNVRGSFIPPHGLGKKVQIAVFAQGKTAEEAKAAGAKHVKLGKVLGPKGLMPNPKTGTVTNDIKSTIENINKGLVAYKNDKAGTIHAALGKVSFDESKLTENVTSFIDEIKKIKPSGLKGNFVNSVYLSSSMGFGLRVEI